MSDFFDDLNKLDVNLDEYEVKELSEIERLKMKSNLKKSLRNNKKEAFKENKKSNYLKRVAIGCILFLGAISFTEDGRVAIANNINSLVKTIENGFDKAQNSLEPYKTIIGSTVYGKELNVTLDEFLIDGNDVILNTKIESLNEEYDISDLDFSITPIIYINGKAINKDIASGSMTSELIDENKAFILGTFRGMPLDEFSNEIDVKIVYKNSNFSNLKRNDSWVFEFKYDLNEIKNATKIIEVNKSFELDGGQKINITNITMTPVTVSVNYTMTGGNRYDTLFIVENQNGEELENSSGQSMGENNYFKFINNGDIESLKITPYLISGFEGEKKEKHEMEQSFPKVLDDEAFIIKIK